MRKGPAAAARFCVKITLYLLFLTSRKVTKERRGVPIPPGPPKRRRGHFAERQYRTPSGMLTFLGRPQARGALWLRSVIIFFHARCSLAPEASPDMLSFGKAGKVRFPFVASPRRGVFGQAGKIRFPTLAVRSRLSVSLKWSDAERLEKYRNAHSIGTNGCVRHGGEYPDNGSLRSYHCTASLFPALSLFSALPNKNSYRSAGRKPYFPSLAE